MKSSLAHLSPTVLAFGAAIGVSLSVFLLSGAGLQGEAIPLLPALGGAVKSVAVSPPAAAPRRTRAPAPSPVSTARPFLAPATSEPASRPAVHRVPPSHHARTRARARVVRPARPAPTPPAPVAVAAPAPATPVSAPQPVSAPKGKAKALGHRRGHAAKAPVTGAPAHGNGHARGHSPEHHQKTPPGQAKKAPAAPPNAPAAHAKAKGGGPPSEHGGGNGNNGGNGHKGDKK
jgi:hypothetical protein